MLPIVLLLLDRAVTTRRPLYFVASTISLAALVLTNWPGTIGLTLAILAYLFAKVQSEPKMHWPTFLGVTALAYGLACAWIPPSTVMHVVRNAQASNGHYPFTWLHVAFVALALVMAFGLHVGMRRLGASWFARFLCMFTLLTGVVTVLFEWQGVALIPQPYRFQPEFEIALCATAVYVLSMRRWSAIAVLACVCLFAIWNLPALRGRMRDMAQPVDIASTFEYRFAKWVEGNMPGQRVFAPGSAALWMNAWTDQPQFAGCCDQSIPSWVHRFALYTIYTGVNTGAQDGPVSLLWLKAFGVQAVGIGGPLGREAYKAFGQPAKFDGLLPEIWKEGDDHVYRVPQRNASLAHVMRPADLVGREPVHGLDVEPLRPYVAALDNREFAEAPLQWTSQHSAHLET
jgi:uncharacterized membrane protein